VTDVGIVGYGTIGKRVADAVSEQPDMVVIGVAKRSPDYAAAVARDAGIPIYAADDESAETFAASDIPIEGTTDELVDAGDVIVDATPSGAGAANKERYVSANTPAIFQGGEDDSIAETSFTGRVNYEDALGAETVRVLSCNSTGLARLLKPLEEAYGVETVRATMIRRGGDPGQTDRGPIDDILPDPLGESHHGPDVGTVLPEMDVRTRGVKVPATLMHLQSVRVTLIDPPESAAEIRELLDREARLLLVGGQYGIEGCGDLMDLGRDSQRPRSEIWENCIFEESIELNDGECSLFQAIDQESIVIPENVDAIRAMATGEEGAESRTLTDRSLDVGSPMAATTGRQAPVDWAD